MRLLAAANETDETSWFDLLPTVFVFMAGALLISFALRHNAQTSGEKAGTISFHGRSDDIIKSGAYRLGPAEIEAAVLQAPDVKECAVIGLPDSVRGQIVSAVVVLRDGATGSQTLTDEIRGLVRHCVGAHAYPRDVRYVDSLPRTSTGKVDRATLLRTIVDAMPTETSAP